MKLLFVVSVTAMLSWCLTSIRAVEATSRIHRPDKKNEATALRLKRKLVKRKLSLRDYVDKAADAVQEMNDLIDEEKTSFDQWRSETEQDNQVKARDALLQWDIDLGKVKTFCENLFNKGDSDAEEQCKEEKEIASEKRDVALFKLRQEISEAFTKERHEYVKRLADLVLMCEGEMIKIKEYLQKAMDRNKGAVIESLKHERDRMNEAIVTLESEIESVKRIMFGDVCLSMEPMDSLVTPEEEEEFNESFTAALEVSYATEGIEMGVISVSILEQYLDGVDKDLDNEVRQRQLGSRSLRMKVGTSYQCSCDSASGNEPKSDVIHRQRDLLQLSHAAAFSGKSKETRDLWFSSIMESFATALKLSIESVFQDVDRVSTFPCSEMDALMNNGDY